MPPREPVTGFLESSYHRRRADGGMFIALTRVGVPTTRIYRASLLAVLFFELLLLRRFEQLVHPQVWDEEGNVIITGLIDHGLRTMVEPIEGYLNSLARLITLISLPISFTHYPLVATIFCWTFIIATMVTLSISPITLRGGPLLAIATMLVPSNAEVFGIPLYTFWFAGNLLFIAALCVPRRGGIWWRTAFVILGGLSSPAIFLALPIFAVRVFRLRSPAEIVVDSVALTCAALQLVVMRVAGHSTRRAGMPASHTRLRSSQNSSEATSLATLVSEACGSRLLQAL